jgi:hypothetical protein
VSFFGGGYGIPWFEKIRPLYGLLKRFFDGGAGGKIFLRRNSCKNIR